MGFMLGASSKTVTLCAHIHKALTERANFDFGFEQTACFAD